MELEDVCAEDPTTWADLADQGCENYVGFLGETQGSVTGDVLNPGKANEGCDESLGIMNICWCGIVLCGVKPHETTKG